MPRKETDEVAVNYEKDIPTLVSDAVFFILAQEQKHPAFKKADIFKNIGLTGRSKDLQDRSWTKVIHELKDVFGYDMIESESRKGTFYLINKIQDSEKPADRHLKFTDQEKAHHGLLMVVLSVVYMNNGVIKDDALFQFLQKMRLWDEEVAKRDRVSMGATSVDPSIIEQFGDIKNLINKEWCQRLHYLTCTKVDDGSDPDVQQFEYRWGERAEHEFKKSDILKFVAHVYDKPVKAFGDQYEEILKDEGEEVFDDLDIEKQENPQNPEEDGDDDDDGNETE